MMEGVVRQCPCGRLTIYCAQWVYTGLCYECRDPQLPKHPTKLRLIQGGKR